MFGENRAQGAISRFFEAEGCVLRRRPLGETEEILSLLTPSRGRLDCVIRRRRKAPAMVEPFTHIHGQFAEGRDLAYLNEVALIYPFAGLRESLTALEVGGHWLQLIYRSVAFEQESGAIFTLLLRALKKLETASSFTVLDLWVQLRLLGLLGVGPELRQCCQCGDTEVVVFHPTSGGMLCAACGSGRMKTGPAALDTLRRLQECRYSAVANLCLEKELSSTLAALLQKTFEAHCFSG